MGGISGYSSMRRLLGDLLLGQASHLMYVIRDGLLKNRLQAGAFG